MSKPTQATRTASESREILARRVESLTRLIDAPGWMHVSDRLKRRQAEIVAQVMAETTKPEDVPGLRRLHAEIATILAIPETDRAIGQRELDRIK